MSKKKHKWISVEDSLPKVSDFYLVCHCPTGYRGSYSRSIVYFSHPQKEWWKNGLIVSNVKYWRKLPAPPEE